MDARQRLRLIRAERDSGFGMIELLVSLVVFSIISTAVAYGLISSLNSTSQNRMRIQAANLASREMELVRHEFSSTPTGPADLSSVSSVVNPHPLAGSSAPMKIDGVPFTLTRTVEWLPAGTGQSPCDGGSAVTYPVLAVNVKVAWTKMGSTKPVESNTVLTPPKGQVSGTVAFIALKVISAAATGQPNLPVTLAGGSTTQSRVTADDGCAVFQVAPTSYPMSYTATVSRPGYVDPAGQPSAVRTASVAAAGNLVRPAPMSYDLAGTLVATSALSPSAVAAGFALPEVLPPYSLYNSGITGSSATRVVPSAGTVTGIGGLWPYASGYESWPGTCNTSSADRPAGVVVPPGGTATINHQYVPVTVDVSNGGAPLPGALVVAYPTSLTGCSTAENPVRLGTTGGNGLLKTSLLTGSWSIRVVGGTAPSTGWPQVNGITRTSPAQTVNVQMGT